MNNINRNGFTKHAIRNLFLMWIATIVFFALVAPLVDPSQFPGAPTYPEMVMRGIGIGITFTMQMAEKGLNAIIRLF